MSPFQIDTIIYWRSYTEYGFHILTLDSSSFYLKSHDVSQNVYINVFPTHTQSDRSFLTRHKVKCTHGRVDIASCFIACIYKKKKQVVPSRFSSYSILNRRPYDKLSNMSDMKITQDDSGGKMPVEECAFPISRNAFLVEILSHVSRRRARFKRYHHGKRFTRTHIFDSSTPP